MLREIVTYSSYRVVSASIVTPEVLPHDAGTVRFLKALSITSVKDYVQIGVGLSMISGGIITAATVLSGGSDATTAVVPTATPNVAVAAPTEAPATPTVAMVPTDTPSPPTATPTTAPPPRGEFRRVQFGTEQDPATLLPRGDTAGPDGNVEICPGETLFAWVEHTFRDGDVLTGRIASRAGTLFSASVPVDARSPNFWLSVQTSDTGIHTLSLALDGSDLSASWSVNVTCGR